MAGMTAWAIPTLTFQFFVVRGFGFHCVGRGGAGAPNRLFGEGCLSRASSLAILFGAEAEAPRRACSEQGRRGRAQAKMLLSPFGETKGLRRAGAKARYKKLLLHPRHRIPDQNLPIIQDLTKRATGPRFRHGLLQARQGLLHPFTGFRLA